MYTNIRYDQPFFIIVDHPSTGFNHLHVLHDCKWICRKCSCARFSWYTRSNSYRRPPRISQMSRENWEKVFAYLCIRPRRVLQIRVGRHMWRHPSRYSRLSNVSGGVGGTQALVKALFHPWAECREESNYRSPIGSGLPPATTLDQRDSQRIRRKRKHSDHQISIEEIAGLLKVTCSCPIEKTFRIGVWMQDTRYRTLRPTDRIVDTALSSVRMEINEWSISD